MSHSNQNLIAYERGDRFRLEIATANAGRSAPEFSQTKSEAATRRKALHGVGYRVTVFEITPEGGLQAPVRKRRQPTLA